MRIQSVCCLIFCSALFSRINSWVNLPQGLKIWILYDCQHTEQPANSDLCRRNATVSQVQCTSCTFMLPSLFCPMKSMFYFLFSSAFGWYLEPHRGVPREWSQQHGPQRWAVGGSSRGGPVHHLLPAEQAFAHHTPDQCGAVHQLAAQLPPGSIWPVRKTS